MLDCHNDSGINSNCKFKVDFFPIPPWTFLIPSPIGRPKVISNPSDVEIENLKIPPHIQHVCQLFCFSNFLFKF